MQVRIYKPAKTSTQSGLRKTKKWLMEFPPIDRPDPNPLMGWAESRDTLKQVHLQFDTMEQAVEYAKQKGLDYVVEQAHSAATKPKSYSDNFRFNKIS